MDVGRYRNSFLPKRQNPKRTAAVRSTYGLGQEPVAKKFIRLLVMWNCRWSWVWGSRWARARASGGSNGLTNSCRSVGRPSCRGCAARRATWKPETDIERERERERKRNSCGPIGRRTCRPWFMEVCAVHEHCRVHTF